MTCSREQLEELGEKGPQGQGEGADEAPPFGSGQPPANKLLAAGPGLVDRIRDRLSGRTTEPATLVQVSANRFASSLVVTGRAPPSISAWRTQFRKRLRVHPDRSERPARGPPCTHTAVRSAASSTIPKASSREPVRPSPGSPALPGLGLGRDLGRRLLTGVRDAAA
jgi:hypothetical protein